VQCTPHAVCAGSFGLLLRLFLVFYSAEFAKICQDLTELQSNIDGMIYETHPKCSFVFYQVGYTHNSGDAGNFIALYV